MSNESLIKNFGNLFLFADTDTDFSTQAPGTAANNMLLSGLSITNGQIDTTSLAASGSARESDKVDFSAARPALYIVDACVEFAASVTAGGTVDFYIAPSNNSTAANGNAGNTTGSDAAYTDESSLLGQMVFVGSLTCDDNGATQKGRVGIYNPLAQYGILVIVNNCDQNFNTDAAETHTVFVPAVYYPGT